MVRLSQAEKILVVYFLYVALIAPFFVASGPVLATTILVLAAILVLSAVPIQPLREWSPLLFTLIAYREMDSFTPAVRDYALNQMWIVWDRSLLNGFHARALIESLGPVLPSYFELCYLLVYGVAPVSLAVLLWNGKRAQIDRFWVAYLAATLGCYALFPFFPSDPPRAAFPGADFPHVVTAVRNVNLAIVGNYGIHSSVFPSAHVASALAAAWALSAVLPERPWFGQAMAIYGFSVALGTVYGRYHYGVDAIAGIVMSLAAVFVLRLTAAQDEAGAMAESPPQAASIEGSSNGGSSNGGSSNEGTSNQGTSKRVNS